MKRFVLVAILVLFAGQLFAQTEIPVILADTVKHIKTKELLLQNNINALLHNAHPEKLPVNTNFESNNRYPPETQDISTDKLCFVRSMFFTGESSLFGEIIDSKSHIISIILNEDELAEAMTLFYANKRRKFRWEDKNLMFIWSFH